MRTLVYLSIANPANVQVSYPISHSHPVDRCILIDVLCGAQDFLCVFYLLVRFVSVGFGAHSVRRYVGSNGMSVCERARAEMSYMPGCCFTGRL